MKTYLGDAVYAELTDYGVRLTTENGIHVTNSTELEPVVIQNLLDWLKAAKVIK